MRKEMMQRLNDINALANQENRDLTDSEAEEADRLADRLLYAAEQECFGSISMAL